MNRLTSTLASDIVMVSFLAEVGMDCAFIYIIDSVRLCVQSHGSRCPLG